MSLIYVDLKRAIRNHQVITLDFLNSITKRDITVKVYTKYEVIASVIQRNGHIYHRIGKRKGSCNVSFVYYERYPST
jgi:hypothetical protein